MPQTQAFAPRRLFSPRRAPSVGLGQVSSGSSFSLCSLIPTEYVPVLRDMVRNVGCNPAARATLSAAIIQKLGGATNAPWYAQFAAVGGPELVASCICNDPKYQQYYPPPQPPKPPVNWNVIAAVAAGVAVVGYVLAKSSAPRPAPRHAAPPAPPPAQPAPAAAPAPAPAPAPAAPAGAAQDRRARRVAQRKFATPEAKMRGLRKIVDEKQAARVDGKMVDLYSASAIVTVYDKISPENQAKLAALPVEKMAAISFQMLK